MQVTGTDAVSAGSTSSRTESFNEVNLGNDFKEVMQHAQEVRDVLNRGNYDIDEVIGNDSINDAYSGQAATSIKNQWEELASTFERFLGNFQNWYDQGIESAREMRNLQESTRTVQGTDV